METFITVISFAARLVLFSVFVNSGILKLFDGVGSRQMLRDFRIPPRAIPTLRIALPLTELLVAALFLSSSTTVAGGLSAAGLLLVFSGAIAWALVRKRTPTCRCFGRHASSPVRPRTIARNLLLTAIAMLAVITADRGEIPLARPVEILLFGVSGLSFYLVLSIWEHLRRPAQTTAPERTDAASDDSGDDHVAIHALANELAPAFSLTGTQGHEVKLADLLQRGRPVLLLFTDAECPLCNELIPHVRGWQRALASTHTIAVIASGSPEANRQKAGQYQIADLLFEPAGVPTFRAYEAYLVPSATIIGVDGSIQTPLVIGPDAVRALVDRYLPPPMRLPAADTSSPNGEIMQTSPRPVRAVG